MRYSVREPKDAPFRVILSVASEARRNNTAEALLREATILRLVLITMRAEIERDSFGEIYLTPLAYRSLRVIDHRDKTDPKLTLILGRVYVRNLFAKAVAKGVKINPRSAENH